MKTQLRSLLAGLTLCAALTAPAQSTLVPVTVSGSAPGTVSLTLPEDVSFTITNTADAGGIVAVFENSVPSGTALDVVLVFSSALQIAVNGGSLYSMNTVWNDGGVSEGALTATDSYFATGTPPTISVGDIVTLYAGTMSADFNANFKVMTSGSYNMFLIGGSGTALSGLGVAAPVPEPTTLALAGLGGLSLLLFRRRK